MNRLFNHSKFPKLIGKIVVGSLMFSVVAQADLATQGARASGATFRQAVEGIRTRAITDAAGLARVLGGSIRQAEAQRYFFILSTLQSEGKLDPSNVNLEALAREAETRRNWSYATGMRSLLTMTNSEGLWEQSTQVSLTNSETLAQPAAPTVQTSSGPLASVGAEDELAFNNHQALTNEWAAVRNKYYGKNGEFEKGMRKTYGHWLTLTKRTCGGNSVCLTAGLKHAETAAALSETLDARGEKNLSKTFVDDVHAGFPNETSRPNMEAVFTGGAEGILKKWQTIPADAPGKMCYLGVPTGTRTQQ